MSALGKLVVPLAVAGAALLAASLAYASRGPVTLTVVSPIVDGTVIDSDDDGAGDWVFDAGSVVVGWGHPALGPGEMRGVFEFDVAALHGRCVENAQLFLNFAGSFGRPSPEVDPHFTLYASPGSGLLSAADYEGGTEIAQLLISDDVAVDVTAVLRAATQPPFKASTRLRSVRFVLAWNAAPSATPLGLLFGSNELEQVHGEEFRAAKLALESTPGVCRRDSAD